MTDIVDVIFEIDTLVVEVIIPDTIFSFAPPPPPDPFISLSNTTMMENIVQGATIGELTVSYGVGTFTFSVLSDPDNMFAVDTAFVEKEGSIDYETQASHRVTIQADNGVDPPLVREFEIDVVDVTADDEMRQPLVVSLSPFNGQTGVSLTTNLVITLDTPVAFASGLARLHDYDTDALIETFSPLTDIGTGNGQMSISGAVLTINPTASLVLNKHYYVAIDAELIDDLVGNSFQGFIQNYMWQFYSLDNIAPLVLGYSPVNNATAVLIGVTLTALFNETVALGTTGTIYLKKTSDDSTVDSWAVSTDGGSGVGDVEIVGGTSLTMHLTTDLEFGVQYYVVWDAGVVKDISGNSVAVLSSTTTWSFTTQTGQLMLDGHVVGLALSLRKLVTDYAGNCVRIKRSSDNTEQIFGFVDDIVDTAGIVTFIGAGSGRVTAWYDQSGGALNAMTAGYDPLFVVSGINGKPTIVFDSALGSTLSIASMEATAFTNLNETTALVVAKPVTSAGYNDIVFYWRSGAHGETNYSYLLTIPFVNNVDWYFGTHSIGEGGIQIAKPSGWLDAAHVVEVYRTVAGEQAIIADGVELVSASGRISELTGSSAALVGASVFNGSISEIVILRTAISVPSRVSLREDMAAFYGITV